MSQKRIGWWRFDICQKSLNSYVFFLVILVSKIVLHSFFNIRVLSYVFLLLKVRFNFVSNSVIFCVNNAATLRIVSIHPSYTLNFSRHYVLNRRTQRCALCCCQSEGMEGSKTLCVTHSVLCHVSFHFFLINLMEIVIYFCYSIDYI